ncbi:MAG: hypothetical protein FJ087_22935, partial [Deltaproteobacteria bacterium]|nr:hypothetical protein [Deltaproteobacteria bacterium]
LACLLTGIRALEPAPDHVRLLWGGVARHTAAEAIAACREARVDELCLVVRPEALRLPDRGAWFPGNLAEVADALERLARPVAPSPMSVAPSPVPVTPSPVPTALSPVPTAPPPVPTAPSPMSVAPSPVPIAAPSPGPIAPSPAPVTPSPVPTAAPSPVPVAPPPVPFAPPPVPFAAPSPVPSLFIELNTLFAPEFRMSRDDLLSLLDRLRTAGGTTLYLSAAEVLDGRVPPIDPAFKSRVAAALPSLLDSVRGRGVVPVLVRADECVGQRVPGSMESIAAGIVPDVTDWSPELVRHEATEGEYGWVLWSLPTWLFRAPPLG